MAGVGGRPIIFAIVALLVTGGQCRFGQIPGGMMQLEVGAKVGGGGVGDLREQQEAASGWRNPGTRTEQAARTSSCHLR